MVDIASGSGRATGRSQRPKSRVDYTSQIYINVPAKVAAAPATSKPKQRNSKDSNSRSMHSTKQKQKDTPPRKSHVLRGSQASAGKSKPLCGNGVRDKSDVTATASPLRPSIEVKASELVHDSIAECKRRRADSLLHEAEPATTTPRLGSPKRKKRKHTGNDPTSPS